jgi:hypothetical protein
MKNVMADKKRQDQHLMTGPSRQANQCKTTQHNTTQHNTTQHKIENNRDRMTETQRKERKKRKEKKRKEKKRKEKKRREEKRKEKKRKEEKKNKRKEKKRSETKRNEKKREQKKIRQNLYFFIETLYLTSPTQLPCSPRKPPREICGNLPVRLRKRLEFRLWTLKIHKRRNIETPCMLEVRPTNQKTWNLCCNCCNGRSWVWYVREVTFIQLSTVHSPNDESHSRSAARSLLSSLVLIFRGETQLVDAIAQGNLEMLRLRALPRRSSRDLRRISKVYNHIAVETDVYVK